MFTVTLALDVGTICSKPRAAGLTLLLLVSDAPAAAVVAEPEVGSAVLDSGAAVTATEA